MNLRNRTPKSLFVRGFVVAAVAAVVLTGCSTNDGVASVAGQNYISGDGTLTEVKPADREAPVDFSATDAEGQNVSRDKFDGKVVVLNFWYASCPPCRLEAPDLESLSKKYQPQGVQFIGINVRDEADTARAFERSFGITYPSVIDSTNAKVQLALSGQRGPNATPTTIVLDQKGRVAARILGEANKSVLNSLIGDTLDEAH